MTKRSMQISVVSAGLVAFLILASVAAAQNSTKPAEPPKPLIPLKVDVVFNDYEGAKKVSSLPYTLSVNANAKIPHQRTSLRMGLRVPFSTGGGKGQYQYQYQDVGTEIDCSAESMETGAFKISLFVQRSSVYSPPDVLHHGGLYEFDRKPASADKTSHPVAGNPGIIIPPVPIFSTFSTSVNLFMRDGQTIQSTMATDPVSGRVLKVDVTLHVVKEQ